MSLLYPLSTPTVAEAKAIAGQWMAPLRTAGDRRPFFFLGEYLDIGRYFSPEQPYYGFILALDARAQLPGYSLRQIAGLILQEIRRVQPTGPYFLGGYCFASVLAFEIALQLRDLGEIVEFLAMVEPAIPDSIEPPPVPPVRFKRLRTLGALVHPRKWHEPGKIVANILEKRRDRVLSRTLNLDGQNSVADFQPRKFDGEMHLYLCDNPQLPKGPERDPRYAWTKWCRHTHVRPMPGDHDSLLRQPLVQTFAPLLEKDLVSQANSLAEWKSPPR